MHFRFGSRTVKAIGKPSDSEHPNVLRLSVCDSIPQLVIQTLFHWLPSPLRSWANASFPEWFLPTKIVLKKQKDGWEEEFDNEIAVYERLKCLQGLVIPRCYGQAQYEGTRALVLSDIGGVCVVEPEGAVLSVQDMRLLFDQALRALASRGITHDDLKLDNFHLINNNGRDWAIRVVDLERINIIPPDYNPMEEMQYDLDHLMRQYKGHFESLRADRKPPPRPLGI
ncbi:hypothetical protein N656DRAFT_775960 [Canariomyces notabilis]|uniref:Protein kinase domain-containing protein n=1 Tax=Canariomyces notabilis TaxID=2074819 RepID=A0AAN6TKG5_9PEZI|nr:hypothetical protein N656DRAFT_775960 [Canariomyces arenarius]